MRGERDFRHKQISEKFDGVDIKCIHKEKLKIFNKKPYILLKSDIIRLKKKENARNETVV